MFQQCPLCKSSTLSLMYKPQLCIQCRFSVCPKCFDPNANRCVRCAPDVSVARSSTAHPLRCSRCDGAAGDVKCASCGGTACSSCTNVVGGRVLCNGCSRPLGSSLVPAPPPVQFSCARCRCPQAHDAGYPPANCEYCHWCARLICSSCSNSSIANGRFVCSYCCPNLQFESVLPKPPPALRSNQSSPRQETAPPGFSSPAPVAAASPLSTQPPPTSMQSRSVTLTCGLTIEMFTDPVALMSLYSLRIDQRVQFFMEDTDHPWAGIVKGFTKDGVVLTSKKQDSLSWLEVDPGFVMREEPPAEVTSPTTPSAASVSSTASSVPTGNAASWKFVSKTFLAQGAQGQVHKCVTDDHRTVVTKEMKFSKNDLQSFQQQLQQALQIKTLRHHHLIQYIDVLSSVDESAAVVTIITPYYNEKDLREFVKNQQLTIDEQHISSLILQVAGALSYLHTRNPPLVHRDVKPENILMCSNGEQALLMDLDTCKPACRSLTVGCGTMEYMAPEAMSGVATTKSDIWSLGVVMFVLAALPEFPTLPKNGSEVCLNESSWTDAELRRALIASIGARSRNYSKTFVELILKMLRRDPAQRPTAADVIDDITIALESLLLGQVEPMNWTV